MRTPLPDRFLLIAAALLLVIPSVAGARVWSVKADSTGDFLSIELAIHAAAQEGDEIDVDPGYYNEALDTQGKGLTLVGVGGPGLVVVDGQSAGSALKIPFSPGSVTIRGITFRGGNGTVITQPPGGRGAGGRYGGGLYMETASPLIENCHISGNEADTGGGIYVIAGAPRLVHCVINGNSAGYGGGVAVETDGGLTLSDCEISGNVGVFGGGIDAFRSMASIEQCRIRDNQATEGGAVRLLQSIGFPFRMTSCVITNNLSTDSAALLARGALTSWDHLTIADNNASPTSAVVEVDQGDVTITNTIIAYGGTTVRCSNGGNLTLACVDLWSPGGFVPNCQAAAQALNADPLFCDHPSGNYTLRDDSPCLPGHGLPGCGRIGALDVGCSVAGVDQGTPPIRPIRWGALKGLYR